MSHLLYPHGGLTWRSSSERGDRDGRGSGGEREMINCRGQVTGHDVGPTEHSVKKTIIYLFECDIPKTELSIS